MAISQIIIGENITIREALKILDSTGKKTLFVAEESKIKGSLTDGDVRRWILKSGSLDKPVTEAMYKTPLKIKEIEKKNADVIMKKYELLSLPVVDEGDNIIDVVFWNEKQTKKVTKKLTAAVIIMAGGKGERLLPYTSIVPKPLLPIGNKSIVELIIDSFKQFGCTQYYLTINYKKNMIKAYFDDLEKDYKMIYIEEDKPLGTGGGLHHLKGQIDDTFFVSNCDILLDTDYLEIYNFHKEHGNIITVITSLKNYVLPYGVINLSEEGYVESITEKPAWDYLINTGVYIIEPGALKYIEKNKFMHITDLIEKCIKVGEQVGTYPINDELWMDMGQFEDMEKMKERLSR